MSDLLAAFRKNSVPDISRKHAPKNQSSYVPFVKYPEKDLSGALSPNDAQAHAEDVLQTLKLGTPFSFPFLGLRPRVNCLKYGFRWFLKLPNTARLNNCERAD